MIYFLTNPAQLCKEHDIEDIQLNRIIIKNYELKLLNEEKRQYLIIKKPYVNKFDQTVGVLVNCLNLTTFQKNLSKIFDYNLLQQLHLNFKLPLEEILLAANLIAASTNDDETKTLSKEIVNFSKHLLLDYDNITTNNYKYVLKCNKKVNLRILLTKLINAAGNQAKHGKLTIILQMSDKISLISQSNYLYIKKILNLAIKNLIRSTISSTNIFVKADIIDNMILFNFQSKSDLFKIKLQLLNRLIVESNGTINSNIDPKNLLTINIFLPLN